MGNGSRLFEMRLIQMPIHYLAIQCAARMKRTLLPIFSLITALAFGLTAQAQFTLHNNATDLGNGCYRLTQNQASQRGAIWKIGHVSTNVDWEMQAEVRFGGSNNGADGMAFVLKACDSGDIGGGGGLMGFGGNFFTAAIDPSVIIEMDTYQGGAQNDPWYDHIGIQKDGSNDHFGGDLIAAPVAAIPGNGNIEDNDYHDLRVTFDATTLEMVVYFDDVVRITATVDIADILGTTLMEWGFTAATGGAANTHRVCDPEWFTTTELELSDAEACPGESVVLEAPSEWINPAWSPAEGLSSTAGSTVTAAVETTTVYTVEYEDICGDLFESSLVLTVPELPIADLPADTTICNGLAIELANGPWPAGIEGTWEDGSTAELRTINTAGTYSLTVAEAATGCNQVYAVDVAAATIPVFDLGLDFAFCSNSEASFDLGAVDPTFDVFWNGSLGNETYTTALEETIVLDWNGLGCALSDTINVSHHPTYNVTFDTNPLVLCLDEEVNVPALDLGWTGSNVQWSWNDGTNNNSILVSNPGNYSVDVSTAECIFTYDIDVLDSENQGIDLGSDILLCGDESLTLLSNYDAANTLWVSGGSAEGLNTLGTTVSSATETVIVEIEIGECIERDTVEVVHVPAFESEIATPQILCLNDSIFLEAQSGADAYSWQNGENDNDLWVNTAGNYTVSMLLDGCTFDDVVVVNPSANTGLDLGADAIICDGEVLNLTSGYTSDETTWWENGSGVGNASNWSVLNQDAIVVAEVTIGLCVERDTVVIDYAPVFDAGLPASFPLCNGDSTLVFANPGAPSYEWNSGQLASSIWISAPGTYTLTIPIQGCEYSTDMVAQNVPLPIFQLGEDPTICEGQSIEFSTGLPNADLTIWSNGADTAAIFVDAEGTYDVEVTNNGCSYADTITLNVQELPVFDLGEDQMLCPDEFASLYIYPLPEEATVSWSTGNWQSSIEVNAPGTYSALVAWNGCTWTDEVNVDRAAPLLIDIVEPLSFCQGGEMVVSAENPTNLFPISYAWSNGETTPAIVIDRQGFYSVVVANACDTVSKSFEVQLDYCECPIYVPNAFTPDNDGVNDLFLPVLGCATESYRLEIYNPWGALVYVTEDPEQGWHGQVNKGLLSTETSGYFAQNSVYNWRLVYELEPDDTAPFSSAPIEVRGHLHFAH